MNEIFADIPDEFIEEEPVLEKSYKRGKRRKKNITKAKRKYNICKNIYKIPWYNNLHQYSKNKIHCSCNLCRFRPTTNPNMKTIQDRKRILSMEQDLKEYYGTN
jgi:hypothetical protein